MAVAVTADVSFRPEAGWDDPNLPVRIWEASEIVTGDATGGSMVLQINLKAANVQPGNAFSLEQLAISQTEVAADAPRIATPGMETALPGSDNPTWVVRMVLQDATSSLSNLINDMPHIFLGRGIGFASAGTLTFTQANANAEVISVVARGYMWSPRSVTQGQGGYRRPIDGIFGN